MPHSTHWFADGILRTYTGVVTGDELLRAVGEIYGDNRFDSLTYIINDFTAIEAVRFEARDMSHVVAQQFSMASGRQGHIRFAVVSPDKRYDDTIRQYVTRVAQRGLPWTINVFDTLAEAQAWTSRPQ